MGDEAHEGEGTGEENTPIEVPADGTEAELPAEGENPTPLEQPAESGESSSESE